MGTPNDASRIAQLPRECWPNPRQTIPPDSFYDAVVDAMAHILHLTGSREAFEAWLRGIDPSQIALAVEGKVTKEGGLDGHSMHLGNTADQWRAPGLEIVITIESVRQGIFAGNVCI